MDRLTKEQRSKNMQAIKCKNSNIEKKLFGALRNKGYNFKKHYSKIEGKPDIVFVSNKLAVFCDSEFWHGKNWKTKKNEINSNKEFWYNKIERNIKRDRKVNRILRKNEWTVLRFWGKDIEKKTDICVRKIVKAVNKKNDKIL